MNKQEFLAEVAKKAELSKKDAATFLKAYEETITKALKKGDSVTFVGFGSYSVVKTAARKGKNPKTGEAIKIPAGKRVKFKAGATLKNAVSKPKKK
ncbi:MAG: HU family DNA-binding protein [Clostridiales Family XIII bacterium]|nr:HU family DNA-binding protein [Clostridiales Family XIII bacterium]